MPEIKSWIPFSVGFDNRPKPKLSEQFDPDAPTPKADEKWWEPKRAATDVFDILYGEGAGREP